MKRISCRAAAVAVITVVLAACGGNKADFKASADSMSVHVDSTKRALDSSRTGAAVGQQVDTTKLGAAKTESILTKARKNP